MGRVESITRELQNYDGQLFAKRVQGRIDVMRKGHRMEYCGQLDDGALYHSRRADHYIFSLTENWSVSGKPVDWGILPILARLKAIDCWSRDDFMQELEESYEKNKKSKERDFSNTVESFMYEFRSAFKKTFNDINTSTLPKIDRRRNKDGYLQPR
jgi:hypothetical protein